MRKGKYFSGTSGLVLPVTKKDFPAEYKDKTGLEYYGSLFNSLEINSSFYRLPMPKTVVKWEASVPAGFRFTYKLWRDITHAKGLAYDDAAIGRFMSTIQGAEDKMGCLLIQFPPSVHADKLQQVAELLEQIKTATPGRQWPIAIELRNRSWYNDDVYHMLHAHHATLVQHDMHPSETPEQNNDDNQVVYIRFHGTEKGYRGSYDDENLQRYAGRIKKYLRQGSDVYVYFNNTLGAALANLQTLNAMVAIG